MNPPAITLRAREEFLAHPLFPQARSLHADRLADANRASAFPGQLKSDVRRVMLCGLILPAEAMTDETDPATWLTPTRLKEAMRSFGMEGDRRIDNLIARLVQTGHLRLDPHAGDGRMRHLRPTDKLAEWYWKWSQAYFEPLHLMFPEPGFGRMLRYDPAFQTAFFRSVARNLDLPRLTLNHDPKFLSFINHDMVKPLLNALQEQMRERGGEPVREMDLLAAVADLGVSRSHFRNVVTGAIERGYAERQGLRGRYLAVTPEWIAASDRFLVDSLASTELNYRATLLAEGAEGERPTFSDC